MEQSQCRRQNGEKEKEAKAERLHRAPTVTKPLEPCQTLNSLGMFTYINLESPFAFEVNLRRMSVRSNSSLPFPRPAPLL